WATTLSSLLFPRAVLGLRSEPCPIIGAYYPVPTTLGSSEYVANATASAKTQIQEALSNGMLDGNTTTLSIQVYSLHDDSPLATFHFTPEVLSSQRTAGVKAVDSNTVYRIGSVSKLWTAYLFLITAGDSSWARPVTDFVPELAAIVQGRKPSDNEIDNVSWDTITVGALASHLAGIARDASWFPDLAAGLKELGLPDQGGNSNSTCGDPTREMTPCNRTFFEDFPRQHPITSSFNTPVYSNAGYQILAYALQNITGRPLSDHFQKYLVESLGLNGTYYHTPSTTDTSIIPVNKTDSWWDFDFLDETPAAGYYSTANDMGLVGKAILNSTLLSPALTRRWLKPHAFTSNPNLAVGAPWEITRAPGFPVSWVYAKSGDAGLYSAVTMLMPDLDVGMSILAAGALSTNQVLVASDLLAANFVPAFWAQAQEQTTMTYAGTYTDDNSNTTITVAVVGSTPGLVISEFTLGGQDVLQALSSQLQTNLTLRLYHMGLTAVGENGTTIDSWRAVFETPASLASSLSSTCVSWVLLNPFVYGGVGLDEFLFTLDST
ncbi:putative beta-lactamase, partial [Thelonectria olida]